MPRYILVRQTASTNTYTSKMAAMLPSGTVIHTYCQTEGRGQRGNSWESEPNKNLAFSFLLKQPNVKPSQQFFISEAASLAIVDALNDITDGIAIKWPNDIYYNDKKLAGILIEHSLNSSAINQTIIGVGLNVNQTTFLSDAPNPVSLKQIIGCDTDLDDLLRKVCQRIESYTDFSSSTDSDFKELHQRYLSHLYRNDGCVHTFALPSGEQFSASIHNVDPDGMFCLKHADGSLHRYAFKEVAFVI